MKSCTKVWPSMFNSNVAIPIGLNVALLVVFTFKGFLIMLTLSEIFQNICHDIHEHVAPVSYRSDICSVLLSLTSKFDTFIFAYSKLDIV